MAKSSKDMANMAIRTPKSPRARRTCWPKTAQSVSCLLYIGGPWTVCTKNLCPSPATFYQHQLTLGFSLLTLSSLLWTWVLNCVQFGKRKQLQQQKSNNNLWWQQCLKTAHLCSLSSFSKSQSVIVLTTFSKGNLACGSQSYVHIKYHCNKQQ